MNEDGESIRFPVLFPRDPHLLDAALRHLPRSWHLQKRIPDDQSKAQDARDKFIAWWQEFRTFLTEECAMPDQTGIGLKPQLPYYAAETAAHK
jgi:hypothetical protein